MTKRVATQSAMDGRDGSATAQQATAQGGGSRRGVSRCGAALALLGVLVLLLALVGPRAAAAEPEPKPKPPDAGVQVENETAPATDAVMALDRDPDYLQHHPEATAEARPGIFSPWHRMKLQLLQETLNKQRDPAWTTAGGPWTALRAISPWRLKSFTEVYDSQPQREVAELQALIDGAKASGATTLTIPPGVYHARTGGERRWDPALDLQGLHDLTIDATGATLMLHTENVAVLMQDLKGVTLKGLTVDRAPEALPYTQGTVVEVDADGKGVTVEIREGYPDLTAEPKTIRKGVVYNPETLEVKAGIDTWLGVTWQRSTNPGLVGPRTYMTLDDGTTVTQPPTDGRKIVDTYNSMAKTQVYHIDLRKTDATAVGDYVSLDQEGGIHGIVIRRCTDTTLEDVTVHTAGMFAIRGELSTGLTYRRVRVTPGPFLGSMPRLNSAIQDGINNWACSGVRVIDCLVEAHSDDAVTLYNTDLMGVLAVDGRTVTVTGRSYAPGQDGVRLLRARDFAPLGTPCTIVAAERLADKADDQAYAKLIAGYGRGGEKLQRLPVWQLTLDKDAAGLGLAPGDWAFLPVMGEPSEIRGCLLRNSRGRGIAIRCRNVTVEQNVIEHSDTHGLLATNEPIWLHGSDIDGLTVRGNVFRSIDFRPQWGSVHGAIHIAGGAKQDAPASLYRNVTITDNLFEGCHQTPIVAASITDLTITNNWFLESHRTAPMREKDRLPARAVVVQLDAVNSAIIRDNMVSSPGPEFGGAMLGIGPGCTAILDEANTVFEDREPEPPEMGDYPTGSRVLRALEETLPAQKEPVGDLGPIDEATTH